MNKRKLAAVLLIVMGVVCMTVSVSVIASMTSNQKTENQVISEQESKAADSGETSGEAETADSGSTKAAEESSRYYIKIITGTTSGNCCIDQGENYGE